MVYAGLNAFKADISAVPRQELAQIFTAHSHSLGSINIGLPGTVPFRPDVQSRVTKASKFKV
jgi:hypothetical protein